MTRGRFTRKQLMAQVDIDPVVLVEIVLRLQDQIDQFETRISTLELNSRNSSKPPSTDKGNFTNPPNPKSQRKKSGRKPGGQKGHKGSTLNQVAQPDHVVEHRFSPEDTCPKCMELINADAGQELTPQAYEKRQVFELPPVKIEVTEHRAQKCDCSHCGEKLVADFPQEVKAPVQYGSNLQATALYLGSYQLIPYQRLGELFQDLFACSLSGGTLANFVKRGGKKAAQT
ncbi:MAG: DUF6444 domain-containing protein, partial [Verrucomicrobiales bacterium]|nr:DUF6444 domain-containing protein [Verrucomicrobiales bacterium]